MALRIKLDDIIEGLESQSFESLAFMSKKTGKVILISQEEQDAAKNDEPLEDYPEWQRDSIKFVKELVAESRDCIQLPTKFDIDEYRIMESFCLSINDTEMRETFYSLIKGNGAFRRFKDAIYEYNIADDWYKYRDNALKQIAIEWCQEHGLDFDDNLSSSV